MSRGLGIMERAVAACIERCNRRNPMEAVAYARAGYEPPKPVAHVRPCDVCVHINNEARLKAGAPYSFVRPTEAQLKAAKRAMHSFVRKFPEYGIVSSKGGRGGLCLYQRGDKLSAMWAKLYSQTGDFVTMVEAQRALAHAEARLNEPFKLKERRVKSQRRPPRVFKDLELPG